MSFFSNLFRKKSTTESTDSKKQDWAKVLYERRLAYQEKVQSKERNTAISQAELLKIFAEFYVPNQDFYSDPGSPKCHAYFQIVNAARDEMVHDPNLFTAATKWTQQQLADLINNPKPTITNIMICGLIFSVGQYAVIKDAIYCVDFCERTPNCIALYLLLNAQKLPSNNRKMLIDAGAGSDYTALAKAMETLKICDPNWDYTIC